MRTTNVAIVAMPATNRPCVDCSKNMIRVDLSPLEKVNNLTNGCEFK